MKRKANITEWIYVILFALYFGLSPFDNVKNLEGATVTKILGLILVTLLTVNILLKRKKAITSNFLSKTLTIIFILYSISYLALTGGTNINYFRFCFLYLLFELTLQVRVNKKTIEKVLNGATIIISILSMVTIFLNISLSYIDRANYYIWNNIAVDANIYCSLLILPILYSLSRLIRSKEKHKILYILMLAPTSISALLTGSRGGLLAIMIGILSIFIFSKENKKVYKKVILLLSILIVLFVVTPYLPSNITERLSIKSVAQDSASNRFTIWERSLELFLSSNPINMFFGHGFLTFKNIVGVGMVSHNLFLQTLIEGGILMLTVIVIMFTKIIRYFKSKDGLMLAYTIAVIAMSCSLDVIVSRFLWNYFIIAGIFILIYDRAAQTDNKVHNAPTIEEQIR